MKALIAIFSWVASLVSPTDTPATVRSENHTVVKPTVYDSRGVHIANPRTVVALEDTHFRPSR